MSGKSGEGFIARIYGRLCHVLTVFCIVAVLLLGSAVQFQLQEEQGPEEAPVSYSLVEKAVIQGARQKNHVVKEQQWLISALNATPAAPEKLSRPFLSHVPSCWQMPDKIRDPPPVLLL